MMYIILGMHKSGTTLISQTLHESGIPMGEKFEGMYPQCKFEDPEITDIIKLFLHGTKKRYSLDIPEIPEKIDPETEAKFRSYIKRHEHLPDWGFKFPDFTLCYDLFRHLLPDHMAIGVYRPIEGLLSHYAKTKKKPHKYKIEKAFSAYNGKLFDYDIPVIIYDDILRDGPGQLSHLTGRELKDCRRTRHG